jgi:two-component system, sensor histidine kinase LadS
MRTAGYRQLPWLLLIGLISIGGFVRADIIPRIILREGESQYQIGDRVAIREDPGHTLDLAGVIAADSLFSRSRQTHPMYGPKDMAVWIAFRLRNESTQDWYLEAGTPFMQQIDLYTRTEAGTFSHQAAGSDRPFAERPVRTNTFIFPLNLPPGGEKTYYLRLQSNSVLHFSLRAGTMQALYEYNHPLDLANGVYFGIILTLILYNLFVFISLRDRAYLYYVLYILFLSGNVVYIRGYGLEFLYPQWPGLNHTNFWAAPAVFFAVLFTDAFLLVPRYAPRIRWLHLIPLVPAGLNLILSAGGNLLAGFQVQMISSSLLPGYAFILGFYTYRKGFRPARFYLLGFGVFVLGLLVYVLKDNGILPYNALTESSLQLGSAMEAIILSFALANKLNTYKREKEEAQTRALKQATAFSQQLIHSQETERKRIAAELHDSVGQSMILIKNKLLLLRRQLDTPDKASQQVADIAETVSQTIGEIRSISYGLRPFQLDLLGLTQSIRSLVEEVAQSSTIAFEIQTDPVDGLFSKEAEINIYRIVQECLNNIVKHSGASRAWLTLTRQPRQVQLTIADNGTGIGSLAAGTEYKNGFGMLGIQERLNILDGRLLVQENPPQGTAVHITLPLALTYGNAEYSDCR